VWEANVVDDVDSLARNAAALALAEPKARRRRTPAAKDDKDPTILRLHEQRGTAPGDGTPGKVTLDVVRCTRREEDGVLDILETIWVWHKLSDSKTPSLLLAVRCRHRVFGSLQDLFGGLARPNAKVACRASFKGP
jgi:hypothetical protein